MKRRTPAAEALILVSVVLALLVLLPLRTATETLPLLRFLASLTLFVVPGALLWRWLLSDRLPGMASVPASFTLSIGLFGLMGMPFLFAGTSLDAYLWVSGAVLAVFVIAAGVGVFRSRAVLVEGPADGERGVSVLWVPFVGLGAVLAWLSSLRTPAFYGDLWVYLAWVREYLEPGGLARYEPYFGGEAGVSRAKINGWFLEQAALSRVSGVDPVDLATAYLNPILVVVALLALYTLARTLFESEAAALFAGSLGALFFLTQIEPNAVSFGAEFVGRVVEDKYTARFLFLPMSLSLAVVFLRGGGVRYLAVFAFLCWSVVTVHPVGLAILGVAMSGFAIFHLALNLRDSRAWRRIAALGAAGASVLVGAALIVLSTGEVLADVLKDSDIGSGDPDVLANMVFVRPERRRILELNDELFIMHPWLLLHPVVLAALVVGVPFLLWRLRRPGTQGLAAQLLLGALLAATVVCYLPPVATFIGNNILVPGQMHRMTWPLLLAALLTVTWMAWEAVVWVSKRIPGPATGSARAGWALPILVLVVVAVVAAPAAAEGAKKLMAKDAPAVGVSDRFDPIFPWIRDNIERPGVILASDDENTPIPAWTGQLNVVSLRGRLVLPVLPAIRERTGNRVTVPQGMLDVRTFYTDATLEERNTILKRNEVDYVLVRSASETAWAVRRIPALTFVENTPGKRYRLYKVNKQLLD